MIGFFTAVHILIAISLCALVLVQDSKGGGALGIGGSGSNSLLGANGAQTIAAKLTRYTAVLFAASCIALTYLLAHENKSVIDNLGPQNITTPAATTSATPPANGNNAAATTANPATSPTNSATATTETASKPETATTSTPATAPAADKK